MKQFLVKVDDDVVFYAASYNTDFRSLGAALGFAVARAARDGVDSMVVDEDGLVFYDLEADTKYDEEDATYPVIVHTRSILVGVNA